MHLIQSGFRLTSDEVVLVDPASLRLRAFPRNLLIREKALLAIQDNERFFEDRWHYEDDKGEIKWMMDPAEIGGSVMAGEAEVGEIFWLQREEGPPLLEAAGMRAVVEMMVKHGMNLKELGEAGVDAIVGIARAGKNYRLRAPHGGLAWDLLRAHLDITET
jgi:hypothetical protein